MATVIGLGVQFSANANGMTKGLSQVDRQLQNLGKQASDASRLFDGFAKSSGAAAAAQQQVATDLGFLTSAFKTGQLSAEEFAANLRDIVGSAREQAAAFAEGARITEQTATAEERRVAQLERLGDLLQQGAIDAEVYGRAVASSTAGFDGTQAERFAQAIAPLQERLQAGSISIEEFSRQASGIADAVSGATSSSQRSAEAILALKQRLDVGAISIEEYRTQFSQIQAGNFSSQLSVEVLGIREGIDASEQLQAAIAGLQGTQIEAVLEVSGVESLDDLRARLDGIDGRQVDALLSVLGVDTVEDARQRLASLDGTEVLAQLQTAGFDSIEQAQLLIDSLDGKDITVLAEALGVESVEQLTAVINAVESKTVTFDADTNADESAAAVASLVAEQREYQQLVQEASRLTQKYTSDEERRAAAIAQIERVNATGALSEEIYARAIEDASGAKDEAARAAQEYASQQARAAAIVEANLSAEERASRDYATAIAELDRLRDAGLIGEQDYAKAVERSAAAYAKATTAADRYEGAAESAGDAGVLQFNELSGVLAAIPGPIGNVAGRLSGLASAGEGLGRVFSGGLSQGLASVGTSVAGLINPFTAGLAAVAAFGAGASALASSLVALEDRVERLGRLSNQLGVSFDFVQTLEEAGNRADVSIEQLSGSFARLQNTLASGGEDSKKAADALSQLGVTVEQFGALSEQQQIELIGQQLATIEDPAQRSAAAIALFGRSGVQLLPFFNELDGAANDIQRLGGAVSDLDRSRLADFGAGIDALGVATRGLGQNLTLPFTGLGEGIAQGSAEFLGGINAIVGPIGDVLEPALSNLGRLFEIVGQNIGTIGRIIGTVLEPLGTIFQGLGQSLEPFYDGIVAASQEIGDAVVATTEWLVSFGPLGIIADNIGAIGETLSRVLNIISTAAAQVGEYIGGIVSSFTEFFGLQSAIESIGGVISSIFGGVSATFETIANAIGGTVGRLLTIAENFLGIKNEVETPITAELDLSQPLLAATQFNDEIGRAATAAAEFGDAGFQAALRYQDALEQVAQLQADGTFSADEAKRAAEQAKQSFDETVAGLEREAEAQRKAAEAAQQAADEKIAAAQRAADAAIQADQRRADSFLASQQLGGEDPATKAAEDLLAITRQIEEAEAAIVAARAAGDAQAEQAALRRLATLDQAQAAASEVVQFGFSSGDLQRAIEEVRDNLDNTFSFDNFEIAPEAFAAAQEQLRELESQLEARVIDPDTFAEAADAIRKGFEDALRTAEQIADLNERYAERVAEIDADRLDALSQVSQQPLQATDLRTSEGASQFLALATGRVDPAVEEYKKQLKELQKIEGEIRKLGGVVDIVGAN
jgi:uncharacterized membrane protein